MLHKFCNWENLSNALTAAWAFPEAIKLEFILLLEKGQYHLLAALMKCHKIRGKTMLWSHKKVVGSGLLEMLWEGLLCLKSGQRGSEASWCGHEWAIQVSWPFLSLQPWSRAVEMTWEECDDMRSTVYVCGLPLRLPTLRTWPTASLLSGFAFVKPRLINLFRGSPPSTIFCRGDQEENGDLHFFK